MRLLTLLLLFTLLSIVPAPAHAETGLNGATEIMQKCLDTFKTSDEKIKKCGSGVIVGLCIADSTNYTLYQQSMCMMREATVWKTIYADIIEKLNAQDRQKLLIQLREKQKSTCVPQLKAAKNDLRMPNYYKCLRDTAAQTVFLWYKSQEIITKKSN